MPMIKIESSDGEVFDVDVQIAKYFGPMKTMFEACRMDDDDNGEDETIRLPHITSDILRKVLQWVDYHKNDPPLDEDDQQDRRSYDISAWDADFLNVQDQRTLCELILAANYLDIKGLLDVTCKTMANMMERKTAEEIRRTFNIVNDFRAVEHVPEEN